MNKVQLPQNFIDESNTDRGVSLGEIVELAGHNLEVKGREEVNEMLRNGWVLLHIYTLKYNEDGIWRERPMAILGLPRNTAASLKRRKDQVRTAHGIALQE